MLLALPSSPKSTRECTDNSPRAYRSNTKFELVAALGQPVVLAERLRPEEHTDLDRDRRGRDRSTILPV